MGFQRCQGPIMYCLCTRLSRSIMKENRLFSFIRTGQPCLLPLIAHLLGLGHMAQDAGGGTTIWAQDRPLMANGREHIARQSPFSLLGHLVKCPLEMGDEVVGRLGGVQRGVGQIPLVRPARRSVDGVSKGGVMSALREVEVARAQAIPRGDRQPQLPRPRSRVPSGPDHVGQHLRGTNAVGASPGRTFSVPASSCRTRSGPASTGSPRRSPWRDKGRRPGDSAGGRDIAPAGHRSRHRYQGRKA
jgi:hypothetical protein